ncbi:YbhB/YbcL family Raf kinase inhibitor-like protein [Enterococcus sp. S22(2020)]|uniref:YbhB/YbcL family Raf kinase inhibitor-like protein n=2 Tax=unclassified Enterococcus TaxID=2608891 RepID=UPI001CE1521E|nr:YbhB/YbcL family Raf kinase inhibitor-like protein [Enterococcus sp. S22(2020)]
MVLLIGGSISNHYEKKQMTVTSIGLKDGIWEDRFGAKGTQINENGIPNYSIPFKIEDAPEETKSYALVLEDMDAYEVTNGIIWIHWVAANITSTSLKENASVKESGQFIQGINSWMTLEGGQQNQKLSSFYGGMAPPNKPHRYDLHVYALDSLLTLKNGFYLNQLYEEMDGHILSEYTLSGEYKN